MNTSTGDAGTTDINTLKAMIDRVQANQTLAGAEYTKFLDACEAYECWDPLFKVLEGRISNKSAELTDYVRLARIQNLYLDDPVLAAETCAKALTTIGFDFTEFREGVLARVVEAEDWKTEAIILQSCLQQFKKKEDQIECLERLCLIHEKKIHNDQNLDQYYSKLLNLDSKNVKALRYFKLVFTQNEQWEEVSHVLIALVDAASHPQDKFRSAQELAAVYLYQLDKPEEALKTIERYCAESPLDTSTIQYDSYLRLGDVGGCLTVLHNYLNNVNDDSAKAILLYKIASHEHQGRDFKSAREHSLLAKDLRKHFYEPFEQLIDIDVQTKNWGQLQSDLEMLTKHVASSELRDRITEAQKRLQDCLSSS